LMSESGANGALQYVVGKLDHPVLAVENLG
jgi:hypothetical protein